MTIEEQLADALRERDEARREADRFRHGCTVEGDFVCPNEYAVSELTAERNFLRALKKNHEEDFTRVCKERDEARANYQWMVNRACDEKLDGYRELGAKCAQLEEERDEARAEVERLRAEAAPMNEHFTAGYRDGYRDAYRRGAEAMREACAQWVDHWVSGHVADKLRDLPIPEEP